MENFVQIKRKYLIFREDAKSLADAVYKKNKENRLRIVFLDFSCVDFMSRSFIDEFLNSAGELEKIGIEIRPIRLKSVLRKFIAYVKKAKYRIRTNLLKYDNG